jgi:hypothetical protein
MRTWTVWDKTFTAIPVLILTVLVSLRGIDELRLTSAANQTAENIHAI